MNEMKRVLALLLCFVMLIGYVPAGAFAAEVETTAPAVEEIIATEAMDAAEETEASAIETSVPAETEAEELKTTFTAVEEEPVVFNLGNISETAIVGTNLTDAALFFSDLHTSASNSKESTTEEIMGGAAKAGVEFSSVTSVGDVFSSNEDRKSVV